ncbi:Protein Ycf2 [Dirofilaria immitis]
MKSYEYQQSGIIPLENRIYQKQTYYPLIIKLRTILIEILRFRLQNKLLNSWFDCSLEWLEMGRMTTTGDLSLIK